MAIPALVTWAAWVYPAWFGCRRTPGRRLALAACVALFWGVLGLYAIFRHVIIGSFAPTPLPLPDVPGQLARMLAAVASYAGMTAFPQPITGSALLARVAPPAGLRDARLLLGLAAVAILGGGLVWLRRHHPPSALALGWYAAALLPTSNLLPVYWDNAVYVAERSLYPALAGWCLFVAVGCHALGAHTGGSHRLSSRVMRTTGAAAVAILLLVTGVRVSAWRDDVTLWTAASTADPTSLAARYNVARSFLLAGDLEAAHVAVQQAVTLFPADPYVATLAARIAEQGGESGRALQLYDRAITLGAQDAPAVRQATLLAIHLQEWGRAGRWLAAAAQWFPRAAWPQGGLGRHYERMGRTDVAREHFERAARLDPNSPERPWFLGQLLTAEGRGAEAAQRYRDALVLDPSFVPARRELALVAEREGRTAEAIAHWRRVADALPGSDRGEAVEHLRRLEARGADTSIGGQP